VEKAMTINNTSEAAKAVVRQNTEEVQGEGGGNFEVFDELFADDFLDHTPRRAARLIRTPRDKTLFCRAADRGNRHALRFVWPTTSHRLDPLKPPQILRLLFQDLPCQHGVSRIPRGKISDRSVGGFSGTRGRRTGAGCDLDIGHTGQMDLSSHCSAGLAVFRVSRRVAREASKC
jgi:hypothetical protein